MRRIAVCFVQLVAMAVVLLQVSRALAPATGTPKFGSFGGGHQSRQSQYPLHSAGDT